MYIYIHDLYIYTWYIYMYIYVYIRSHRANSLVPMSIRALVIKPLLDDASVLVFGDGDGLSWPFGGMAHQKFRHTHVITRPGTYTFT